jgi:hypothetical protein
VTPGTRSSAAQLDTYREQFWLRHLGSLRDDYPVLEEVLGKSGFEALVRAYLEVHPPTRFHLRDLGDRMADFVSRTRPWSEDRLLADCARLEWALIEAFDAADAPPLAPGTVAALADEDWPCARLTFHPSVRLVASTHPVQALRMAVRADEHPPRPAPTAEHVVVYRRAENVHMEVVGRAAFALLERLARGEALGPACEHAMTIDPTTEDEVGAWFQRWVTLGWVVRVTT